jgi:hypothetical protein
MELPAVPFFAALPPWGQTLFGLVLLALASWR